MTEPSNRIKCFGTAEATQFPRQVVVGDFAYQVGPTSVRNLCWRGHEVIRAISWPIRDSNWITLRPTVIKEVVDQSANSDHYQLHFQVGAGSLDCKVSILGYASGELRATLDMQASADFATNRAGFTVLHPISGVAGSDLQVKHADGSVDKTQFPTLISPDQPVKDFVGLRHHLHGIDIDIEFEGEVFEMEDQRNWSDASYKTYCVPLVYPFTYTITGGAVVQQSIAVKLSGGVSLSSTDAGPEPLSLVNLEEEAPQIGLAIEEAWEGGADTQDLVALCDVQFLLARINLADMDACLSKLNHWSGLFSQDLDLEIVFPECIPTSTLIKLADQLNRLSINPKHVIALPESYLASYQPSGPWPDGPTPDNVVSATKKAFPDAAIGAGMLTNFTEFNRCHPDTKQCDYVTHGSSAIVHAADDQSVIETLEALPQIFNSTNALRNSRPYRLGLVSIAGRTNPYGSAPAANPTQIRQALAQVDPRQRGLFAAVWAVGVLGATSGHCIEAIALAAPCGPFGIVWQQQDYPQPGFDENYDAVLYPLFHVVRAASAMSSLPRVAINALPTGVVAYGVQASDGIKLILANTLFTPVRLIFAENWQSRILDTKSFESAVRDPLWTDKSKAVCSDAITLNPCAIAFQTQPRLTN